MEEIRVINLKHNTFSIVNGELCLDKERPVAVKFEWQRNLKTLPYSIEPKKAPQSLYKQDAGRCCECEEID
nr:hypothetical protein MarFTME_402 [Marseillevirus futianmevirus]